MEKEIIVAVIGAVATLIGPILTLAVTRYIAERGYITKRLKYVEGEWRGQSTQVSPFDPKETISIQLKAVFKVRGKSIEGELTSMSEAHAFDFKLVGHFPHEDFMIFQYKNANLVTKQFGACVVSLSANAKSLSGEFVGFGDLNNQIVSGRIEMKKSF